MSSQRRSLKKNRSKSMNNHRYCDYCNVEPGTYQRGDFVSCRTPECMRKCDDDYEAEKRNAAERWSNMITEAMRHEKDR